MDRDIWKFENDECCNLTHITGQLHVILTLLLLSSHKMWLISIILYLSHCYIKKKKNSNTKIYFLDFIGFKEKFCFTFKKQQISYINLYHDVISKPHYHKNELFNHLKTS